MGSTRRVDRSLSVLMSGIAKDGESALRPEAKADTKREVTTSPSDKPTDKKNGGPKRGP